MKQQTITSARKKLLATVAGSHNDLAQAAQTATTLERRAALAQRRLRRRMPKLEREARRELESGDQSAPGYGQKQRAYLTAVRNMNRAEKAWQIARRQRVLAERMQ